MRFEYLAMVKKKLRQTPTVGKRLQNVYPIHIEIISEKIGE